MPNWCSNNVTFTHEDPVQIQRVAKAYNENRLFSEFMPLVEGADASNVWGTKWEVESVDEVEADGNTVSLYFDSAWSPPIRFYESMTEMGFDVEAYYFEPGMSFCGVWTSEDGDEYHDIRGDSAWVRENIPEDIDEMFGIADGMEVWEHEQRNDS